MAATISAIAVAPFINEQTVRDNNLILKGPHWGDVMVMTTFLSNVPFVLYCTVEDGQIIPKLCGLTKEELLSYVSRNETRYILSMIFGVVGMSWIYNLFGKPLWRNFKAVVYEWWASLPEAEDAGPKKRNYSPEVD